MKRLTCEDFEAMGIVELVEFIDKRGEEIKEYEEELEKYFRQLKPESFVPFLYYDVYLDVRSRKDFDLLDLYLASIKFEDKPKALDLLDDFYELHWIDKKRVERTKDLYVIRAALFVIFLYEGNMLFLEELLEKGYFESRKAQAILERYVGRIHEIRYSKNDDIMSALAIFMKNKDEPIQKMITELIVEDVERSERSIEILLYTYKHGISYAKRGALYAFLQIAWRFEIDFSVIESFLEVIAADLVSEDIMLKNGIVNFIDYFSYEYESVPEDEVLKYLLEEKGIDYDDIHHPIYVEAREYLKEKDAEETEEERIIRRYYFDKEHEGRF